MLIGSLPLLLFLPAHLPVKARRLRGAWREGARFSLFYALMVGSFGVYIPYWTPFLLSLGLTATQVGVLFSLSQAMKVVSPNFWSWAAFRLGGPQRMMRLTILIALLVLPNFLWITDYGVLLIFTALFAFVWTAPLPVLEKSTLDWSQRTGGSYGRVRLWGSLGFLLTSFALGPIVATYGPWMVPVSLAALLTLLLLSALLWPTEGQGQEKPHSTVENDFGLYVRHLGLLVLLLGCALQQASHGPYYVFYSVFLHDLGMGGWMIGSMWAFSILVEVVFFMFSDQVIARFGLVPVLLASFVLTVVRWVIIALWPGMAWGIFAQALHAATYGAFHASAMRYLYHLFPEALRLRGQALYNGLVFGLGSAVGALIAGFSWESLGAEGSFIMASAMATVALALAVVGVRGLHRWPVGHT